MAASRLQSGLSVVAVVFFAASASQAQPQLTVPATDAPAEVWSEPRNLLKEDLKTHWKHFTSVDQPLTSVWNRKISQDQTSNELVCTGEPRGYLYTRRQFDEFDLNFEWRYESDPNGNSGVLVFTQDDRRLWPTSIQVQLHQPEAGCVFPSGGAVTDNTVKNEGLAEPVGEWNKCQIVSRSGRIVVHINEKKAGEVTGCKPASGRIAFQSEGSEVHFRRIMIRTQAADEKKDLTDDETDDESDAAATSSDEAIEAAKNSNS